ncbi:hypothetical protein CBL_05053 [Carabus blaptoides fortunei]
MGPIQIVSPYQQPTKNILPTDLDAILSSPLPTIIAGDLNAKSQHGTAGAAGHRPDVLDIALLRGITSTHSVYAVNELSSDHNPVILELTGHNRVTPVFHDIAQQLDEAEQDITAKIQASIRTATSVRPRPTNNTQLPQDIVNMIRDRNRARRRWQLTVDPADRVIKNRLATQVHDALRELRNQRWRELLDDMGENENSMWRISKSLRVKRNTVPAIHSRNGLVYTATDKAEAIVEELELQCSPSYQHADVDFITRAKWEPKKIRSARAY